MNLFVILLNRWIVYKTPKLDNSMHSNVREGSGVFYMTNKQPIWKFSNNWITQPNNVFSRTLAPLYDQDAQVKIGIILIITLLLTSLVYYHFAYIKHFLIIYPIWESNSSRE